MNVHPASSPATRRIRAGLGAVCLCGLIAATVVATKAVVAQDASVQGQVIQRRGKPFRESVGKMKIRSQEIARKIKTGQLPPRIWPRPDHIQRKKPPLPRPEGVVDARTFIPPGAAGAPVAGSQAPQAVATSFDGTTLSHQWDELGTASIPPDTMGAVGPNHFVIMINGSVAIYNKSTGARVSFVGLDDFFFIDAATPDNGTFDPRIVYDRFSGRWFACVLDFANGSSNNHIILAVSATSDPTGAWDKYFFTAGDANDWADYESLAVDANGVYFGWRNFFGDGGARIAAAPKAELLDATPTLTVTAFGPFTDMFSTPQPALNLDNSAGGRAFFVGTNPSFLEDLRYKSLTWSGSVPTLSAVANLDSPAFNWPINFAPSGSTMNLDVGDMRVQMAIIRDNKLWTCRNISVNSAGGSSGTDRNAIEWFVLDVSTATASILQNGRVFDPNAGPRHYFYGSIAPNAQGHAAMTFSGAKTSEFVGIYTCGRLSSDAVNTMQTVDLLKAGVAAYTIDFGSGRNRWGDYSYTSVDPDDDQTIWTVQEYAEATGSSIGGFTSRWGTRVFKLAAPAPTMSDPNATANQGDNDKVVNLTGTGFFDPGAGFTNRMDITISGDGISGISETFTNSTTASVTFDVAENATPGERNITLTNPDGQSATVIGALTIEEGGIPAPTNLVATAATATRVDLTWMDNSPDENGFKIERKTGMGAFSQIKTVGANVQATVDNTASPSTTYTYRVRAYIAGENSGYSNEDDATTPALPNAPSNLNATAVSANRIDLTWQDNSGNETSFKIERKTGAGGTYAQIGANAANDTTFTNNSGLAPSTEYFYRVRSSNANGVSVPSNEDSATTLSAPATPTNLTATAVNSSRIDLAWTDNATDETLYKIERKAAGAFAQIATKPANTVAFINNSGLTPNTLYTYRVRAFNANGHSAYSNEEPESTPPLPIAPSNCNATAVNATRIDVTWDDNSADETQFKIERKTGAGGTYAQVGATAANVTAFTNNNLTPNTLYFYRVRSSNANGLSTPSNEDSATTLTVPNAPSGLNATAISSTRVDLAWTDNASDESGFKIERKTGAGGTYAQIGTRGANVTSFSNTGLTPSTTYFYRVRAHNANGNSAYSNEDSATTAAAGPLPSASKGGSKRSRARTPAAAPRTIRRRP